MLWFADPRFSNDTPPVFEAFLLVAFVIPAQAGIHHIWKYVSMPLDSRLRGNDG